MTDPERRKPRPLAFSQFKPVGPETRVPAPTTGEIRSARDQGFIARTDLGQIDGRSLRATGRTKQLNLKVTPAVRDRFILLGQNHDSLGAFLEHLLDTYERADR